MDPKIIQALDDIAPVPTVIDEDEYGESEGRTIDVVGPDGRQYKVNMSDREVKLELHKTAAEFIAVAQLLKDLNGITDIMDFASKHGIAFKKNQIEQTKSTLKNKLNDLRNNIRTYSNVAIDPAAEYER